MTAKYSDQLHNVVFKIGEECVFGTEPLSYVDS